MLGNILFVVGFLLLIGVIGVTFWTVTQKATRRNKVVETIKYAKRMDRMDDVPEEVLMEYEKGTPMKVGAIKLTAAGVVALFLLLLNGTIYYAEPGYNYLVQYPWGTQIGEVSPGYHMKFWGTAEPFKKFITVKADKEKDSSVSASISPIEGRFTDAVLANVEVTTRYQLPASTEDFLRLAISFRTQDNLENSTLIPVLKEVVRNSARTMTAQDYIAGKGGEFENAILDQLRYGTYILDIEEIRPEGKVNVADADEQRQIDQSQLVKYRVKYKYDKNGQIIRKPTAIADYKIIVAQANVANVDPEVKFKEMLAKQRDAAAEASVKKQEAKRAEYEKQKIIAEGEAQKAGIKVEQEKAQITKLIAAETAKKEAEIQLQEARIQKEREKELAAKVKIAADAKAYEKKALILADGALEAKLAAAVQMNKDTAQALAQRPVPQNYFAAGGSDNGGYDSEMVRLLKLLNLQNISNLNLDMGIKK